MTLLDECIFSLGNDAELVTDCRILKIINNTIFTTEFGRLDWKKYRFAHRIELNDIKYNKYYIIWDDINMPILNCDWLSIFNNIDDVLAVSFDTWMISEDIKNIIEFYHEGTIIAGSIV